MNETTNNPMVQEVLKRNPPDTESGSAKPIFVGKHVCAVLYSGYSSYGGSLAGSNYEGSEIKLFEYKPNNLSHNQGGLIKNLFDGGDNIKTEHVARATKEVKEACIAKAKAFDEGYEKKMAILNEKRQKKASNDQERLAEVKSFALQLGFKKVPTDMTRVLGGEDYACAYVAKTNIHLGLNMSYALRAEKANFRMQIQADSKEKWVDIEVNTKHNELVVHFKPATPEAVKAWMNGVFKG